MSLPQFNTTLKLTENSSTTIPAVVRAFNSLVTNLQQIFTSLLKKVQLDSSILQNIQLQAGMNIIPHTLGRTLSGWEIIRLRGPALIYDNQDTGAAPGTYLYLTSSTAVSVNILVF
jgi:hypothetical protein